MRANFVGGGLLLVISIIHTVCDGRGISDVLNIFAAEVREAQTCKLNGSSDNSNDGPGPIYTLNRNSLLSTHGLSGAIENHPGWTIAPMMALGSSTKSVCINFHISNDSLRALKAAASPREMSSTGRFTVDSSSTADNQHDNSTSQPTFISTHDAVAALLWRSIMLARHRAGILSKNDLSHFSQAVDCRSLLNLPKPYFGNAVYGVKISLDLLKLTPPTNFIDDTKISGLQVAARMIRDQIQDTTADKFRDLVAFVKRTQMEVRTRLSVLQDLQIDAILLISYFRFEMHDLDFGDALGGKIEAFRLPSQGLMPGMPVILPRLPDGSCEFLITEREDVMSFLQDDEIFQVFVNKE